MARIREVLREKGRVVHTVRASERIADVLGRFSDSKIRSLAVTENGALSGLVTIRDVVAHIDRHGADALNAAVEDAMTRDVTTVSPETTLDEAEAIFAARRFHHLPVEEEGMLVGVVTPADVLSRHLQDEHETSELMRDYCSGVYY